MSKYVDIPKDWKAEHFRVTAFPDSTLETLELGWWKSLLESSPERIVDQPAKLNRVEQGTFKPGRLTLTTTPVRIGWRLDGRKMDDPVTVGLELFDDLEQPLISFTSLVERWLELETSPAMKRIAFGTTLLLPVNTREDGYRRLSGYLHHLAIDPEGSSDLTYQINRPRTTTSSIEGLTINRLSNWSVITQERGAFVLDGSSPQMLPAEHEFFCTVTLDINTSQQFQGHLPQQKLTTILNELVKLAFEIAVKGDIP